MLSRQQVRPSNSSTPRWSNPPSSPTRPQHPLHDDDTDMLGPIQSDGLCAQGAIHYGSRDTCLPQRGPKHSAMKAVSHQLEDLSIPTPNIERDLNPHTQTSGQFVPPDWQSFLTHIPTKADFQALITEVRDACKSEICALRTDIQQMSQRMSDMDDERSVIKQNVHEVQTKYSVHANVIRDLQRQIEDLDNRGRRNNIRIKGLPKPDGVEDLDAIVTEIFNDLLDNPPSTKIDLDRAHRALRARGSSTSPRDVICRVHFYKVKESILQRARNRSEILWHDSPIQRFPDLSWHTLQQRKCLQPLLSLFRDNNIKYRWGYPFSLTARRDGISATLRFPEKLSNFSSTLRIACPKLPGWESLPLPPPAPPTWSTVTPGRRSARRNLQHSTPLRRTQTTPGSLSESHRRP